MKLMVFCLFPFSIFVTNIQIMAYKVKVYMLNPHFSQEHADAQHGGKETENNKYLDWEDELEINNVEEAPEFEIKGKYILRGVRGENEEFSFEIPEMNLFHFKDVEGNVLDLGCSESLYEKHLMDEENKILELYLKGEPYANPIAGVYIASLDFPTELISLD